jgi:hypothetical protein
MKPRTPLRSRTEILAARFKQPKGRSVEVLIAPGPMRAFELGIGEIWLDKDGAMHSRYTATGRQVNPWTLEPI